MIRPRNQPLEPRAAVVIVNWNGAAHLRECLDSLREQTIAEEVEVIVVDNGSTDSSVDLLASYLSFVQVIRNAANLGFAAACNQGIQAARAPMIAALNNDAVAAPDWLAKLTAAMQRNPEAGMCASKVLSYFDRKVIDNAGHVVFADGLTRGRGRLETDQGQYDTMEEVFGPSGSATLMRRQMLEDVGPFDDHFFAYCEDADLAFRARLCGWRCLYVPEAVAYHKFSATTDAYSAFKAFQVERNRMWLAVKNLPLPLLAVSPLFTLARYFWQAVGAFTGRGASGQFATRSSRLELLEILIRANFHALRELPRVLRQRRLIQSRRALSTREVWRLLRKHRINARAIALLD